MNTRITITVLLAVSLFGLPAMAANTTVKTPPAAGKNSSIASDSLASVSTKTSPAGNNALNPNIPSSFSLRSQYQKLGLDIEDQGLRGSCTLFGVLGALEFDFSKSEGKTVHLSEQFAGWAADQIGMRPTNYDYSPGNVTRGIQQYGVCTSNLMPYLVSSTGVQPSKTALADASSRAGIQYSFIYTDTKVQKTGFSQAQIMQICGLIAKGQPVPTAVLFSTHPVIDNNATIQTALNSPNPNDGHLIVMIGYELDAKWPGGGRMEFRNSWGKSWGKDGYAWFSFAYLQKYAFESVVITTASAAPKRQTGNG